MEITVITPTIRPQFLHMTEMTLGKQTFKDFEHIVVVGDPANGFTLPKDYNEALRKARGRIIVSLQDCIEIPENALEKIASYPHEKDAYTYPVVKQGKKPDWRMFADEGEINNQHWEIDFGSAPRQMFFDIGGFDEAYCDGWSCDNVEVGIRASHAGYRLNLKRTPAGVAMDHDEIIEHPFRNTLKQNSWRLRDTMNDAMRGEWKKPFLH